jgi:flavin reductase (DIM6/NTAB) family NADH-FMN oxidoreductase RutF
MTRRPGPSEDGSAEGPEIHPHVSIPAPTEPTERTGAARFRRAVARYATGIALVTTVSDGLDHAMTANSFTSVSLDPMLALVCVQKESQFHEAVLAAGQWAVSFLPEDAAEAARWFATRGRPLSGQFARYSFHRGTDGCLLFDEELAGLELRTVQTVPAGDHDILVGRVIAIHDPEEVTQPVGRDPVVFYGSQMRYLA